jgi:hypothetical protein
MKKKLGWGWAFQNIPHSKIDAARNSNNYLPIDNRTSPRPGYNSIKPGGKPI